MQMTRADILDQLKKIFVTMDPSKADIAETMNESSRLVDDLGLTSVAILYVVIAIEETFSIRFDNLGVNDFGTIGDAIGYIEEKLKK